MVQKNINPDFLGFLFKVFTLLSIFGNLDYYKKLIKMDTKIIVKEVDRLKSQVFKGKYISEYIIYLNFNGTNIEAFTELGEAAKTSRILDYIFPVLLGWEATAADLDIIEVISFEEFKITNKIKQAI